MNDNRRTCRRGEQYLQVASSAVRHVDDKNHVLQKIDLVVLAFAAGRLQGHNHLTTTRHHSTAVDSYVTSTQPFLWRGHSRSPKMQERVWNRPYNKYQLPSLTNPRDTLHHGKSAANKGGRSVW